MSSQRESQVSWIEIMLEFEKYCMRVRWAFIWPVMNESLEYALKRSITNVLERNLFQLKVKETRGKNRHSGEARQ